MILNETQDAIREMTRQFAEDVLWPNADSARQVLRISTCRTVADGRTWPHGHACARGIWWL